MGKSMVEELKAYLDSDEGMKHASEYFSKLNRQDERDKIWAKRFDTYFETLNDEDFGILLEDFTIWEVKYDKMWYDRGIITYSNILSILLGTAEAFGTTLETEEMFEAERHEYRGYVFSLYQGQGSIIGITYKGKRIF